MPSTAIPGVSSGGSRDATSSKPVSRRAASGRAASDRGPSGRSAASGHATVPTRTTSSLDNTDSAAELDKNDKSSRKRSLRAIVSRKARKDIVAGKGKSPKQARVASSAKYNKLNKSVSGSEQGRASDSTGVAESGKSVSGGSGASAAAVSKATGFVDARALQSEDLVAKTLNESTGPLGVAARPKVVDFNERVKERQHANTLMVVKRVAITIISIAAVVGIVWALFFSPLLRLDAAQITVTGANEWVSSSKVESIASAEAGKSLLLVSSHDIETQLAAIPGVSKATATKQYPNGMQVTIRAQEPAAMLKTPDGALTAVDGKGRVLNSVKNASTAGIPVIEVNDVAKSLKSRSVVTAVKVVDSLSDTMRARVSKVTAQTQDSITTELDNGNYTIIWGNASQMKLKKAVVDKIINDPNVIGDKHSVDVSAPLRPIIK
ncbi:cell division protein FtsQ/DivIB [Bifidobacterium apri]|uniref:cell division protein FtsQ/DivIB n=1 Tax=Bifidobacterium apri TaxID=1769423 RepID=UPI001F0F2253|nr:FtsQ-type POTRA domain-containing protein [Bifidobacterium apri]